MLVFVQNSFAQHAHVEFKENKGQWENNILYRAKIPAGELFLEKNKLTYQFYNEQDMLRMGDIFHGWINNPQLADSILHLHAFQVEFFNALPAQTLAQHPCSDYENYFIGNDTTKWSSNVKKYQDVTYQNIYNGIQLKLYSSHENGLKYDFIVNPNADVNQIQLNYNGVNEIFLKNGRLNIKTSVNDLIEQQPYAYQIINGKEKEVKCNFNLTGTKLNFSFPRGYNKSFPLIIDPALIFASYTGSTADNFGFTSTFDEDGDLFGGGVVYGIGYPTTIGAFQTTFHGGSVDIGITKFNPYGTNLIFSTYIGGVGNDYPHSLIVNHNNELLILGTTRSIDFPVTPGCYDNTQNGSSDIFVAKLNATGNVMLGSTYIGGSADDGLNWGNPLKYNYADQYRGEIVVDQTDYVFVASTTQSPDFPTTAGVFQPTYISGETNQNACVIKLSPNLTSLNWSTFFGGTMDDAAYSLQFDELGNILFTGGTKSADLPVSATAIKTSLGGIMDGYITKITPDASTILACTYIGTDTLDQTFFVQLDTANNVFVYGQTEGNYPITPIGVYADSNSGQFLHKLTPNLDSTIFSTTFGTSSGHVDIAPSAFLVNSCNYILISGWGGRLNANFGMADYSTTNGLPVTANAQQLTTDGQDYYLAMFGEDAQSLIYATYFGGYTSADHVDGGTSRFDKKGMVYQAVCSSCEYLSTSSVPNTNDFPTTPGAWSNTDNSTNCNLGVFKLDLTNLTAIADIVAPSVCLGETAQFINHSIGGISFLWNFGDGNFSTDFEPFHIYDTIGAYTVSLVVLDSTTCNILDSDFVDVEIIPLPQFEFDSIPGICPGDSTQLNILNATTYTWITNYNISDTSIANPIVWPATSTNYSVIVNSPCGIDTLSIFVQVYQPNIDMSPDTIVCRGQSVQLFSSGGANYLWTPNTGLNNDTLSNPLATPDTTTTYQVEITTINLCVWDTFATIYVDTVFTNALASSDVTICRGDTAQIYATEGRNYSWSPTGSLSNPTDSFTLAFPSITTAYIVESSNFCNTVVDTVVVTIHQIDYADNNKICLGDSVQLDVINADNYTWLTNTNISDTAVANPNVWPTNSMNYTVVAQSVCGLDTVNVFVEVYQPNIDISPDTFICVGQSVPLLAGGGVSYLWIPASSLNMGNVASPIASPTTNTTYDVEITDINNCVWDTSTTVVIDSNLPIAIATTSDDTICKGDTTQLIVSGSRAYQWFPSSSLSNPTDSVTLAFPIATTNYVVGSTNGCGTAYDTVLIAVLNVNAQIVNDTSVCIGEQATLWAAGGASYWWEPSYLISNPSSNLIQPTITNPTLFTVNVVGANGCKTDLSVMVNTKPTPWINLEETVSAGVNNEVEINPETNGVFYNWAPSDGLSCTTCLSPIASSGISSTYTFTSWSEFGCVSKQQVTVLYQGILYVPNAFTPDGDGDNDIFYAFGKNIVAFNMMIFDRWGEKLFTSDNLDVGWDGTYKGKLVKTETYVWKIKYKDVLKNTGDLIGTVTLIR